MEHPSRQQDAVTQLQAMAMAHRVVLAYLVKVARSVGDEGTREMMAATEQALRQSLPQLFSTWPPTLAARAIAQAEIELDGILTAPWRDAPRSAG